MSYLLSDFLKDKIQPVPQGGLVNAVAEYELPDSNSEDSEDETDQERDQYVLREADMYHRVTQEPVSTSLCDIEDGGEESILGSEYCAKLEVPKVFEQYKFDTHHKRNLPIDSYEAKILQTIDMSGVVIIQGPTGCGKTTQVPQFIMDDCRAKKSICNIVVTQPRRIAAINISQRVCQERGWTLGTVCGYQVGLDRNISDDVILTYMTTEVLLQKLITHRNLNRYTHIIIDEVHERSKTLDFLLLIARKYHFTNSPLTKIILMSATMEASEYAYYFRRFKRTARTDSSDFLLAPIITIPNRQDFITHTYYLENLAKETRNVYNIDEPRIHEEQLEYCAYLAEIFDDLDEIDPSTGSKKIGSVLVFLPGISDIETVYRNLIKSKQSRYLWDIIPLHSSLSTEQMIKAFETPKPGTRKIILSTNIAESSLTVPDVSYVIDFCLTKILTINESTKFSSLTLQWASQNNCTQRAGRVGRVAAGRVYRLVPEDFYQQLPESLEPEMQRAPLESIILYLKLLDIEDPPKNVLSLAINPPNLKDIEVSIWRLKEVGALLKTSCGRPTSHNGDLTFIGRVMGNLPIDISLAKLIILGHMFSCLEEAIIIAAGATTSKIFINKFQDRFNCYKKKLLWADHSGSDFIILLNLYNVWLKARRDHKFRTLNEEISWCKLNHLNLKGLREWEMLIKEITNRLKRMCIEKPVGITRVNLTEADKVLFLKIIICGAFYPHYFIRSSEYGQVDTLEALRTLNGRDPFQTVYFSNMKLNQPGQIYVRQIKSLLNAENNPNVHIGFDKQSTKVFVSYEGAQEPEAIKINGSTVLATVSGRIAMGVYEAVRKRQLQIPFPLRICSFQDAWKFVESATASDTSAASSTPDDVNCFTEVEYSPFPPPDLEYMTVCTTHVVSPTHFYCQNWTEETKKLLEAISNKLNAPQVFLERLSMDSKVELHKVKYAARFNEDDRLYRCKVLCIDGSTQPNAQVQFVDYGDTQRIPMNCLHILPETPECNVVPLAMCCQLSEIQPCTNLENPNGIWSENVNETFRLKVLSVLLNARVYSIVQDVVHLELYPQNHRATNISLNDWLINEGLARKACESHLSTLDHKRREEIIKSGHSNDVKTSKPTLDFDVSYTDFDEPEEKLKTEEIHLKGPFSPLEMKIGGLIHASDAANVKIDGTSVNAVLLDDVPDDSHSRLLVAGLVMQYGQSVKLNQTTLMPCIPGFPMMMMLLFCPEMEPKLTPDGRRVASILCGLGKRESENKPCFQMHDFSFVLDTELNKNIITAINELRYFMNRAVRMMEFIYYQTEYPENIFDVQLRLKDRLKNLLHLPQRKVEPVKVAHADTWDTCNYDAEILKVALQEEEADIWPLLWFVKLNEDEQDIASILVNLDELNQIAKKMIPEKEIQCDLCNSQVLKSIANVRVHLVCDTHKANKAKFDETHNKKTARTPLKNL